MEPITNLRSHNRGNLYKVLINEPFFKIISIKLTPNKRKYKSGTLTDL